MSNNIFCHLSGKGSKITSAWDIMQKVLCSNYSELYSKSHFCIFRVISPAELWTCKLTVSFLLSNEMWYVLLIVPGKQDSCVPGNMRQLSELLGRLVNWYNRKRNVRSQIQDRTQLSLSDSMLILHYLAPLFKLISLDRKFVYEGIKWLLLYRNLYIREEVFKDYFEHSRVCEM